EAAAGRLINQLVAQALTDAARDGRDFELSELFMDVGPADGAGGVHWVEAGIAAAGHEHGCRSTRERNPDQSLAASKHRPPPVFRPHPTTFTILCGTTMTFLTGRPSSARCTVSSLSAAASISPDSAVRAMVSSSRRLPFTCTAMVIISSTSKAGSASGHA